MQKELILAALMAMLMTPVILAVMDDMQREEKTHCYFWTTPQGKYVISSTTPTTAQPYSLVTPEDGDCE